MRIIRTYNFTYSRNFGETKMFEQKIQQSRGPMYDPEAVQPMRDELVFVGFEEMLTPDAVDAAIARPGATLVMVNSVCGCAAGSARPGVTAALQHTTIPDSMVTVFAGMERDAVDRMRMHFGDVPPSSPFIALFKDGLPVYFLQRFEIEGTGAQDVASRLKAAFNKHCTRQGPSIPAERYAELEHAVMCGSKIPRMN
jgi:putative YphP/YqiW family bacilliredoxin